VKFCGGCGAKLEARCSQCGAGNPPTNKFCHECGTALGGSASESTAPSSVTYTPKHLAEKILTSKSALEGERKQVTVLFADLKGSMELLAERDPEEARKLLDPVLEHMMEAVHRYEGTVNQVMGDGIMALFGAPLAHEDHAVRACYAALRMQERLKQYAEEVHRAEGIPIQIRVGLNSGEVVVRSIGSDLRMDYTAVGPTTHLAARMEQMAMPGVILIPAATLNLVEGYVVVKPLGPRPVKGLDTPVEVYEVTGAGSVRSRFHSAVARGLTRFVGRTDELEQLRQAFDRARAGHGQVVAMVGEPGIGKSRLYWEFTHSHHTEGWLILESRSVSYGKATSYLPVIDLLKAYFQIEAGDEARKIREKVTDKLLSLDEALKSALPAFLALLDLPVDDATWQELDPSLRRQRTLDAVKRLMLRESQVQPLLLVFEDLHWIDGETQAVLDGLVESLPGARLLLLGNYRPEYHHNWRSKTYYTQLRIDPLPPESVEELLAALLGEEAALEPLKQLLVAQTEGNPFFLEETVRTLVETKALVGERGAYRLAETLQALQVPATVQAVLAARIDRLAPEHKRLLQVASVVGKDGPFALLQAIAELPDEALRRGLNHLQAAEFVYETGLFLELEYTFKHALTHEVAYGGLLQERRRQLHARIVDAIETLHRDRLGGEIERLAHHALRGELREKAVDYLRQAGLKASARSALQDARVCFEQALAVLEGLPESLTTLEQAFEIRLELRTVLALLGDLRPWLERLREAGTLAERLNDDRRRGLVCAFVTNVQYQLGDLDQALVTGARGLEIAERHGDLRLRVLTTIYLEMVNHARGEYEQTVKLAIDNLTAVPIDWLFEHFGNIAPPSTWDRFWIVVSLAQLGRFAETAEYEAQMIRFAGLTHHAFPVGLAYYGSGTLHLLKGDWEKARSSFDRAIAAARTGAVARMLPYSVASSAWALATLGDLGMGLDRLREGEQLLERLGEKGIVGNCGWEYQSLGRACLVLGQLDDAQRLGRRTIASSPSHPGYRAHALHLLGDIGTHPERFDAPSGEAHYRKALALAEPRGMRPLLAHCHLGLAKLYRRTGKRQEAQEHLATATTMYREMDMRFYLEQAEAAMREMA
jgi:class 3 adenylate cyclase/tetratricopeptide (TPR) repeat protein